ncbi:dehydrogenase [Nesterenkonia sp. MY13]|uniref:Dehydrogenase n=1 Tax=Nesterenkonia sedimenti TaxID=1463632 RepID=A0A7X8TL84_9MICC|nr:zinc-binding alcohol dehydrogenase [Nesterenkonia sedimenti]NLS10636.1 dehydrogenase [Nesterenkonia sedimenti]
MANQSHQFWIEAPYTGRLREVPVPEPGPDQVLIRSEFSGISAGTETLVYRGEIPPAVAALMAAPQQLGELPYPVSHGYLNVGTVEEGPEELLGRRVFTLSGHRSHLVVPTADCHLLDEQMPSSRALLGGIAEVGLNATWESEVSLGDRVAVIGAGLVGLVTGLLLQKLSPARLELVELDPVRRRRAADLGLKAVTPEEASGDNDAVLHTSATAGGLNRALELTGDDGVVVEMSWYGTAEPQIALGADFHARRLRLASTQVGEVAAPKRLRRSRRQRLATALELLDERFDALITGSSPLVELPRVMDDFARRADWTNNEILHIVTYDH